MGGVAMLPGPPLEFDSDKDRQSGVKHGMSLADAERMEWVTALLREAMEQGRI